MIDTRETMRTTEKPKVKPIRKRLSMSAGTDKRLERLGLGVVRLDRALTIIQVSDLAAAQLRKSKYDLEGRPLSSAVPEENAKRITDACAEGLKTGAVIKFEMHVPGHPGRWVSCRCLPEDDGPSLVLEDVTAEKKAGDEALNKEREARRRLEIVYDSIPVGMCLLDPDMRCVKVNEYLARMNGLPADEHRGRSVREIMPLLADRIEATARGVIESGRPRFGVEFQEPLESPGGSTQTWITHWIPVADESGRRVGVNIVLQNITELKDAIKALKGSEERYRTLHDTLVQGVIELDEQNRIVSANSAAETIIGLDLQEMYGRELPEALSWMPDIGCEDDPLCAATFEKLQALKEGASCRNQVISFTNPKLGRQRWISVDCVPRFGTAGDERKGAFVFFSDITDLKRAQDVLRDAGRKLQKKMRRDIVRLASAVESAGEGIVLLSPSLTIEYVNTAFEQMSGYRRRDLVGKSPDTLGEYFMGDRSQDILGKIVAQGKAWSGCRRRKRKTGEIIEVNLSVSPIRDESGSIINYIAVVRDVTREIMLQRKVAEIQKTEDIGNLAGGIAHDLKNIFTPIILNTETALADLDKDETIRPMLQETLQAARLGSDLVSQIVTFGRKQVREKHPVAASSVLSESVAFLRSVLPSTIEIRHRSAVGRARIMADPIQIKQVLINLGDNAGYAMRKKGGMLDVVAGRAVLSEEEASGISPELPAGNYVRILVRDTGEGMDEQTVSRVFEPFFTTKKPTEGAGMGLAIAREIVRDHRGEITVWSRKGKGTTFSVFLPVLQVSGKEGKDRESLSADAPKARRRHV